MANHSKVASQEEAKRLLAAEEAARKRAARQAAVNADAPAPAVLVTVRVLPMGDAKISMGLHAAGIGEAHYEKGETFSIAEGIAEELEARGYVEIQAPTEGG